MSITASASQHTENHRASVHNGAAGFTMVEMIVTLVIMGVLSAVIMTRFLDANTFNAIVVRDQLVAMIRVAQQNALGRSNVSLSLTPSASGDNLTLVRSDSGGVVESVTVDLTSVALSSDNNIITSCGSPNGQNAISNATPLTINFGELGSLANSGVTGNVGAVNSALRICVNNDPVFSVCVSPSGFAYRGNCDD